MLDIRLNIEHEQHELKTLKKKLNKYFKKKQTNKYPTTQEITTSVLEG